MQINLKKLLIIGASSLLLAGCCTTPDVTKWEYRVVRAPFPPQGEPSRDTEQSFLNDLGKDGWVLVCEREGLVYYLKRPIK